MLLGLPGSWHYLWRCSREPGQGIHNTLVRHVRVDGILRTSGQHPQSEAQKDRDRVRCRKWNQLLGSDVYRLMHLPSQDLLSKTALPAPSDPGKPSAEEGLPYGNGSPDQNLLVFQNVCYGLGTIGTQPPISLSLRSWGILDCRICAIQGGKVVRFAFRMAWIWLWCSSGGFSWGSHGRTYNDWRFPFTVWNAERRTTGGILPWHQRFCAGAPDPQLRLPAFSGRETRCAGRNVRQCKNYEKS